MVLNALKCNHMTKLGFKKPNPSICYILPYRPNLLFLISDIRALALSPERQSARMSEIKNCRLDPDGTEHFEM